MTKITLIIVGLAVAVMGVLALIPGIDMGEEPMWHAVVKIIVGIAALVVAFMDKPKSAPPAAPQQ